MDSAPPLRLRTSNVIQVMAQVYHVRLGEDGGEGSATALDACETGLCRVWLGNRPLIAHRAKDADQAMNGDGAGSV